MSDEIDLKKQTLIAIDFDGTITCKDVVDSLLEEFSIDNSWKRAEEEWKAGKIGSAECLNSQLESIRVNREELQEYLSHVEVDSGFKELKRSVEESSIPWIILSDGFDFLIQEILRVNQLGKIPYQANSLQIVEDRLKPSFPHQDKQCTKCANCKRITLNNLKKQYNQIIFIGDGQSDRCAVDESDVIYAKGSLKSFCESKKITHIPYSNLLEVSNSIFGIRRSVN